MMSTYNNILVIKLKHLGDVLIATPVITALKDAYPNSRISVLVNKGTEEMIIGHPAVDEVIVLDRGQGLPVLYKVFQQIRFARELRDKKFDLVLELSVGDRGAILSLISGANERVGFDPGGSGFWGRRYVFTRTVQKSTTTQHMVDYDLALVRALGIKPLNKQLTFCWSDHDAETCRELLLKHGIQQSDPYLVMHPTSRWMFKAWHARGCAEVCDHIYERYHIPVVITSAPEATELKRVRAIMEYSRHLPIDLAGKISLKALGCLIAHSKLFIGVDSAPMHIAAAVNTPVIALFGPTGDHMWGPWCEKHFVVKKGWDCQPCGRDGCNGSKVSRCLEEITSTEVTKAVDIALKDIMGGNRR